MLKNLMLLCSLALVIGACGDDDRPTRDSGIGGGDVGPGGDAGPGGTDTGPVLPGDSIIEGVAWAPGNAPGMVPAGHEIPVFGAIVRATPNRLEGIPQNAYCERCVEVTGGHAISDHRGNFRLPGLRPGEYWLSIQKGQFRIERQITIGDGVFTAPQEFTTLPSVPNTAAGDFVPRIAVATGIHDDLQDVLGKMSIGSVNSSGNYASGPGIEAIDWYDNGGTSEFDNTGMTLAQLVADLPRMLQYHVIFIPCASSSNTSALDNQQNLRNIRDYVAAGGRLYVTDWSGEWHDNVFPAHITLGSGEDTPASAYDRDTDTWNTSLFGDADGGLYDSNNAEAVDEDLNIWLSTQTGPLAEGGEGLFNPNLMDVVDNWNTIENVNPVQIGVDDEGLPVGDTPRVYVIGGQGTSTPKTPLTVTYQPAGCGRVLYSTYHTTPNDHQGLVPQERILLYLIMEIGVCVDEPILI